MRTICASTAVTAIVMLAGAIVAFKHGEASAGAILAGAALLNVIVTDALLRMR